MERSMPEAVKEVVPSDQFNPVHGIELNCDVEVGATTKVQAAEETVPKRCDLCCRTRRRKGFCMLAGACSCFMLAIMVCAGLFWPRDPSWELTKLEVTTPDALMYFVMAFAAGPSAFDENATYPDVKFYAEAEVFNPNLLGGEADTGAVKVLYHGQELGLAISHPSSVKPQSNVTVGADVTIKLDAAMFQALSTDVISHDLKLTIQLEGAADVTGPLGIRIKCRLECDVFCSVGELFNPESRHAVVEGQSCRYRYL
eukprot:s4172_g4.t1